MPEDQPSHLEAGNGPSDTASGQPRNTWRYRVLELGGDILFGAAHPDQTVVVWSNLHSIRHGQARRTPWGWAGLATAFRWTRSPQTDLVVWHAKTYAPWDLRYIGRCLAKLGPLAFPYLAKDALIYLVIALARAPVVAIDRTDHSSIGRHCIWAMKRAVRYFKRELPPDRWQVVAPALHATGAPTRRIRRRQSLRRALDRVRPISLGVQRAIASAPPPDAQDKTTDLLFSGAIDASSTVRTRGVLELEALSEAGVAVSIIRDRLAHDGVDEQCRRAWLVWSPEGHGWDCFRHYEVPMCGSVPLINRPRIERYAPLLDGVHCFYYDVEPGGLMGAVEQALKDRRKLLAMAKAARAHVEAHHTRDALCDYVRRETGIGVSHRD